MYLNAFFEKLFFEKKEEKREVFPQHVYLQRRKINSYLQYYATLEVQ